MGQTGHRNGWSTAGAINNEQLRTLGVIATLWNGVRMDADKAVWDKGKSKSSAGNKEAQSGRCKSVRKSRKRKGQKVRQLN